jgi:acyl-CoA synthetase (AMP-forming)/AMP-acid ligase II
MRLLPEKLLESAAKWPHACALAQGQTEVSYEQLAGRAAAVARWLRSSGVSRGDRVALLCDSGADYVAVYYGALLAGAAAVGLNTGARAEEILGWVAHSGASAIFVDGAHPETEKVASRLGEDVRVLARNGESLARAHDSFETVIAAANESSDLPQLDADSPAALIYTSGTTGAPKAVVLTHGNLAANTDSIVEYLGLSARDSIVSVLPFYYSYGNSVLHTHIASGARIVLEQNLVYPHIVVESMARNAVTGFAGVPSTFALLASRVPFERYDLSSLRYVTQAGGPMSPALTERIRALLPHARLFVMYGQTEASARLTYVPPEKLTRKLGSVGIPIPGVEIEIRAEDGSKAPPGATGEVWARGPNVMRGYWNDPEATRKTLVDGWLRTGDAGRVDEDGYLFLEGRRSDIIKVGAHRVYPRDIEAVIEELPGVKEVAVVGADDELLGEVVKACIVKSPGTTLPETAVKAHCRARLATYKIPKIVEFLAVLPKTSSGKVRRMALTSRSTA